MTFIGPGYSHHSVLLSPGWIVAAIRQVDNEDGVSVESSKGLSLTSADSDSDRVIHSSRRSGFGGHLFLSSCYHLAPDLLCLAPMLPCSSVPRFLRGAPRPGRFQT